MTPPAVRPARAGDAPEIADLLRRSITELCGRDHRGDEAVLADWLANKTPEIVAGWIADPGQHLVVAEIDGRLACVAGARADGVLLLNYVAPELAHRGASTAAVAAVEAWLRGQGAGAIRLISTQTARDFYLARGYRETGPPVAGRGADALPMAKALAPPPGLVIFDCDGVLVDSEPIALRLLLETLGEAGLALDAETANDRFLGRSLASTRAILAEDFGLTLTDAALAAMRGRLYAAFQAELQPIPGVPEVLAGLPQPFCVASSSQPERIELSLRITGLWSRFEGRMFSASMVANGKPAPDLFLFAAERMGYAPADCLVVEDSPAGIEAARAAGMRVMAFTGGSHAATDAHRAAIAALRPDAVIRDMRLLVTLVA